MTPFELGLNLLKSNIDGNHVHKGRNIYEKAEDWPFRNKDSSITNVWQEGRNWKSNENTDEKQDNIQWAM